MGRGNGARLCRPQEFDLLIGQGNCWQANSARQELDVEYGVEGLSGGMTSSGWSPVSKPAP